MELAPRNPAGEASGRRDQSAGYARRRHPARDRGRGFDSRRLHHHRDCASPFIL